ncbi:Uracil-DNA glycosylase superfamily [Halopiger xanaduensis SH-6]|uniref:Uracil-DNA glycosylase superfamily n=1 Tax=Halopiger xanaduensis (strain DSM 18323 / JCM 14033 / SH-6) TaxID=797210 RepID=F8DB78_HALXS|nr:uracil-DNA glycosylase [Halopiger xanaduensis]AEH35854.1 Uracil-DNA glycosylase superfamily [Halopiger xanaduensis SH-6]
MSPPNASSPSDSSADAAADASANADSSTAADSDASSSSPADPPFPQSRNVIEPDCARCPALAETRECISWGTGPLDASVIVVGEAPGPGNPDADRWKGGNWTGKGYTSRHSGRRIRRMLAQVGYDETAYYTNAVKCFPADPEDPSSNREPTPEERANCRPHLLTELETIDPTVVLATGKHATKTVLAAEGKELDGFIDCVLEPVRCEALDVWLVPILHPSYQDVWIGRLGYEPDEYLAAIRETLEDVIDGAAQ